MNKVFIGVAWPYANGEVHLGHIAGAILPADIFARYKRLRGYEVLMVSGSDEHGTPITLRAEQEGKSPQEIVDKYHKINSEVFEKLGITFSLYFRTSHPNHHKVVQEFFLKLYEKGFLYEKSMLGTYCPKCQRFLPDRYVEGECPYCHYEEARGDQCDNCGKTLDPTDLINPRCKICGSRAEFRETKHFFFKLSEFQKKLEEWVEKNTHWRKSVRAFTLRYLKSGLKDRAITRDIEWGVRIPIEGEEYEKKRIYVWFDAVIGYLSASKEYSRIIGKEDYWKDFWMDEDVKHYYFLGKDNIPFHTIIWPAMLMAHGSLNLPYDVPANQYLRFKGVQFSKSRGVGVWMPELLERYDPDVIRFYAAINMPENHDSDFSWEDFVEKINKSLIDTFANFVHRALTFTYRKYGEIPAVERIADRDAEAIEYVKEMFNKITEHYENIELKRAAREIINLAHYANRYFDERAPWSKCKECDDDCKSILYASLMIVKALAVLSYPIIPKASERIWHYLGYDSNIEKWEDGISELPKGQKLRKPEILFKKVESPSVKIPLTLRVGEIIEIKEHPNADKLYILTVDFGDEKRQIIAGLRPYYSKEDMLHKRIVVVTNMKKAKLRGEVSEGMLLAADDGKTVSLIIADADIGEYLEISGIKCISDETVDFKKFSKIKMRVVEHSGEKTVEAVFGTIKGVLMARGKMVKLDRNVDIGARVR